MSLLFVENYVIVYTESEEYNMKRNRNSLTYRVRMWLYRLTKEDIYKIIWFILDNIGTLLIAIMIFALLFIFPAFFH